MTVMLQQKCRPRTAVTDRRYNSLADTLARIGFSMPPDLDGAGGGVVFAFHRQFFPARRLANHDGKIRADGGNDDDVSRPAKIAERTAGRPFAADGCRAAKNFFTQTTDGNNGAIDRVAADVSPLKLKNEPTHVGCYK